MKIDEAVILLGGMGTRLLPYTKTVSKEMLPIYDVPAIFLLVKEAYLSGIKKIIFVTTPHNRHLIKSFFSKDKYLEDFLQNQPEKRKLLNEVNEIINKMEFIYVNQIYKGTYGALYSAKKYLKKDYFIVMYGDDLIDCEVPLTKQLIDDFMKTNKMQVAVYERNIKDLPMVGIVKMDKNNNLIDLVKRDEANSKCEMHGRMLLNKKIFDVKKQLIKHNNDEFYLSYALLKFQGEVEAYKYQGDYFNLGSKTGYIKASIHYALKKNSDIKEYIDNI